MTGQRLAAALEQVEARLIETASTDVEILHDAALHIIAAGGKRLRPRLVLLSYLAAGGQRIEDAIDLATAIELVHTATLVHDDINDHSVVRRGQMTIHARWGRTFALLAGDYLFTKVYELMAPFGSYYNQEIATACVHLVEGESLQASAVKSGSLSRETYHSIITRKTASLFSAGARVGAVLAGASDQTVAALSDYAHNLGLAFQITDDVLDVIGDPGTLGKPVGSDLVQGAGAFNATNGQGGLPGSKSATPDPIEAMMARMLDSGAIEVAKAEALEMASRAREALSSLPESDARTELESLVGLAVAREI